jgi:hypothetical protein
LTTFWFDFALFWRDIRKKWVLRVLRVRLRMVKVIGWQLHAPHRCDFESSRSRNLSCEEAVQVAYGRSVVLPSFPPVPETMPVGAPGVFLHKKIAGMSRSLSGVRHYWQIDR